MPEVLLDLEYKGLTIPASYRIDLLVADRIVVELKAVDRVLPIHKAQLMTYLRLAGRKVGLLLNFNVKLIRDGIHRVVL